MILKDGGRIVRNFPFVPGIDFSGTVVNSEDSKFKKEDIVNLLEYFKQLIQSTFNEIVLSNKFFHWQVNTIFIHYIKN